MRVCCVVVPLPKAVAFAAPPAISPPAGVHSRAQGGRQGFAAALEAFKGTPLQPGEEDGADAQLGGSCKAASLKEEDADLDADLGMADAEAAVADEGAADEGADHCRGEPAAQAAASEDDGYQQQALHEGAPAAVKAAQLAGSAARGGSRRAAGPAASATSLGSKGPPRVLLIMISQGAAGDHIGAMPTGLCSNQTPHTHPYVAACPPPPTAHCTVCPSAPLASPAPLRHVPFPTVQASTWPNVTEVKHVSLIGPVLKLNMHTH